MNILIKAKKYIKRFIKDSKTASAEIAWKNSFDTVAQDINGEKFYEIKHKSLGRKFLDCFITLYNSIKKKLLGEETDERVKSANTSMKGFEAFYTSVKNKVHSIDETLEPKEGINKIISFFSSKGKFLKELEKKDGGKTLKKFQEIRKIVKELKKARNINDIKRLLQDKKDILSHYKITIKNLTDLNGNSLQEIKKALKEELNKPIFEYIKDNLSNDKNLGRVKGYSAAQGSFISRVVSGVISAWFVSNDFYNYSMFLNGDKKEAQKESHSKLKQELIGRVGMTAALTYFTLNMLKEKTDKSLKFALAVSLATGIFCELVSRLLTGRSILPLTKKQAQRLKANEENEKHTNYIANTVNLTKNSNNNSNLSKVIEFMSQNSVGNTKKPDNVSFRGRFNVIPKILPEKGKQTFSVSEFSKLMKFLQKQEPRRFKKAIKDLSKEFEKDIYKHFDGIYKISEDKLINIIEGTEKSIKNVPIGESPATKHTKRIIENIFMPVKFVKDKAIACKK